MTDLASLRALPAEEVVELGDDGSLVLRRHTTGSRGRVLALHGLATSSTLWRGFLGHAPADHELWTADLPWRGGAAAGWARQDAAAAVGRALDGVPGGVDWVVAHSFSAMLLLELLCRDPRSDADAARSERLRGIVLATPLYRARPEDFGWDSAQSSIHGFERLLADSVRLNASRAVSPETAAELVRRMREAVGPYGWVRFFQAYLDTPRLRVSRLAVPSLVVTGSADLAAPPAEGRALAERLPDARLVELDCGHFVMAERPGPFAAAVSRFLAGTAPAAAPAAPATQPAAAPAAEPASAPEPLVR